MFGLSHLLTPTTIDDFVARYRGERALLIAGPDDKFADLFGWDDVNTQLNMSRRDYAGLRLVYEKQNLPHEEFANVAGWLTRGATLVINNVNQIDPVTDRFSSTLARDLNTHVNINCYVSCPTKQGFDLHFDRHDVSSCRPSVRSDGGCSSQPSGIRCTDSTQTAASHRPRNRISTTRCPPETSCTSHADTTGTTRWPSRPSIHLTVGPESRSGAEFLSWLVEQITENDEFFRQDFPSWATGSWVATETTVRSKRG